MPGRRPPAASQCAQCFRWEPRTVISVLLADDQELVRTGIRRILESEPDLRVVAEAGDGADAVSLALSHHPDVVLMDIRMPRLDGLAATRALLAQRDSVRVVILTTFDPDEYVFEALRAGASGFLLKTSPAEQLLTAIRVAASGDSMLAPPVTRRLIAEFARRPDPAQATKLESDLTERELDVLRLVARGLSNAEIGGELHLAAATVKTHIASMLQKFGLRDRVQLVVLAYETGLIRPGTRRTT
jgi:DNA-binding NarL/FixJ family response regulator